MLCTSIGGTEQAEGICCIHLLLPLTFRQQVAPKYCSPWTKICGFITTEDNSLKK